MSIPRAKYETLIGWSKANKFTIALVLALVNIGVVYLQTREPSKADLASYGIATMFECTDLRELQ